MLLPELDDEVRHLGLDMVAGRLRVEPADLSERLASGRLSPPECVVLHLLTGFRLAELFELSLESFREGGEADT